MTDDDKPKEIRKIFKDEKSGEKTIRARPKEGPDPGDRKEE